MVIEEIPVVFPPFTACETPWNMWSGAWEYNNICESAYCWKVWSEEENLINNWNAFLIVIWCKGNTLTQKNTNKNKNPNITTSEQRERLSKTQLWKSYGWCKKIQIKTECSGFQYLVENRTRTICWAFIMLVTCVIYAHYSFYCWELI